MKYPWMVALLKADDNHPFCGGNLIASRWVLTAAHCPEKHTIHKAVLGEFRISAIENLWDPTRLDSYGKLY